MTLSPALTEQARCGAPEYRDLVDKAFDRPGGPAQRRLEKLCATCPIWEACLLDAVAHDEHGPWGGTNERTRRARTGRGYPYTSNITDTHDGLPSRMRRAAEEAAS